MFIRGLLFTAIILMMNLNLGSAVKCYQCSTDEDPKGKDLCGAYQSFREEEHVPVDCLQDESVTPGTFCVKVTKQSPRSFIWDGRWRTVIRRCASVTETGVTNVCNWGVDESGVYFEECYCTSDGCNAALPVTAAPGLPLLLGVVAAVMGAMRVMLQVGKL